MTVWIVIRSEYHESDTVYGVYNNEAAANAHATANNEMRSEKDDYILYWVQEEDVRSEFQPDGSD